MPRLYEGVKRTNVEPRERFDKTREVLIGCLAFDGALVKSDGSETWQCHVSTVEIFVILLNVWRISVSRVWVFFHTFYDGHVPPRSYGRGFFTRFVSPRLGLHFETAEIFAILLNASRISVSRVFFHTFYDIHVRPRSYGRGVFTRFVSPWLGSHFDDLITRFLGF